MLEAVRRRLVPGTVYNLLRTHAQDPHATAAHMQCRASGKVATELTHCIGIYLQQAATLPTTDVLLKLLFYQ